MPVPTTSAEKKLTLKQRKWLKVYLETGNATEAARQAYDCTEESARVIASENLAKLNYGDLMEQAGVSDKALLDTLRDGLAANKVVSARIIMKGGSRDAATSETDDFIEVPDHPARHKFLETALKLKKRLGPESVNLQQFNMGSDKGNSITFVNFKHEPESK